MGKPSQTQTITIEMQNRPTEKEPTEDMAALSTQRPEERHLHRYRVLNRSQIVTQAGLRWCERCRCGSYVTCDLRYGDGRKARAVIVKNWFDRNGALLRITGLDPTSETSAPTDANPNAKD